MCLSLHTSIQWSNSESSESRFEAIIIKFHLGRASGKEPSHTLRLSHHHRKFDVCASMKAILLMDASFFLTISNTKFHLISLINWKCNERKWVSIVDGSFVKVVKAVAIMWFKLTNHEFVSEKLADFWALFYVDNCLTRLGWQIAQPSYNDLRMSPQHCMWSLCVFSSFIHDSLYLKVIVVRSTLNWHSGWRIPSLCFDLACESHKARTRRKKSG